MQTAVSARLPPEEGLTVLASRYHGSSTRLDDFLRDKRVAKLINFGSSVKFCRLAEGIADLYPRFGRTMEWDTCAPQAVLEAAGGTVRTFDGDELRYGKPGWENPHFVCTGGCPDRWTDGITVRVRAAAPCCGRRPTSHSSRQRTPAPQKT